MGEFEQALLSVDRSPTIPAQDDPAERWVFLNVWQNVRVLENGDWRVNCEVVASRMGQA